MPTHFSGSIIFPFRIFVLKVKQHYLIKMISQILFYYCFILMIRQINCIIIFFLNLYSITFSTESHTFHLIYLLSCTLSSNIYYWMTTSHPNVKSSSFPLNLKDNQTWVSSCPCPSRLTPKTVSILNVTCIVPTVGWTWFVTVLTIHG